MKCRRGGGWGGGRGKVAIGIVCGPNIEVEMDIGWIGIVHVWDCVGGLKEVEMWKRKKERKRKRERKDWKG